MIILHLEMQSTEALKIKEAEGMRYHPRVKRCEVKVILKFC